VFALQCPLGYSQDVKQKRSIDRQESRCLIKPFCGKALSDRADSLACGPRKARILVRHLSTIIRQVSARVPSDAPPRGPVVLKRESRQLYHSSYMPYRITLVLLLAAVAAMAQTVTGLWDATVTINGRVIPFRMEFTADHSGVTGTFFNGEERFISTGGKIENGSLTVDWDQYLSRLQATLHDGLLTGNYTQGGRRGGAFPFEARPHSTAPSPDPGAPSIGGLWELEGIKSGKGESTWRFIVQQSGSEITASILRVDGDTER